MSDSHLEEAAAELKGKKVNHSSVQSGISKVNRAEHFHIFTFMVTKGQGILHIPAALLPTVKYVRSQDNALS